MGLDTRSLLQGNTFTRAQADVLLRAFTAVMSGQTVAEHVAATDPHPQYQTQAEGDARYSAAGHGHAFTEITGTAAAAQIPTLDAAKIGSGVLALARIPSLDASRIPTLDAAKVGSGVFDLARIPVLDASRIPQLDAAKIGTGTLGADRIPQLSPAKITQDASNRFVTDAEKATWNGKQAALGYTPANRAGDTLSGRLAVNYAAGTPSNSAYGTGQLELIDGAAGTPRVGFHRAGQDAVSLEFHGGLTMKLRDHVGNIRDLWTSENFNPATKANADSAALTGTTWNQGGGAGYRFSHRDNAAKSSMWYATGDIVRLWMENGSEPLTINYSTGAVAVNGSLAAGSFLHSKGTGAGLSFDGRDAGATWTWYATGGTARLYVPGSGDVMVVAGGRVGIGGAAMATAVAAHVGAIGQQTGHFGMVQGGIMLWQQGIEGNRDYKLWSYNDDGTYAANPVSIAKLATPLTGGVNDWYINGAPILHTANFPRYADVGNGRLGPAARMGFSDWNAATENGWWMGSGLANAHHTGWVIGQSIVHNPLWVQQEVYDFTQGAGTTRYRRHMNNGVWGAWTYNLSFRRVFVGQWSGDGNYDGLIQDGGAYMIISGGATDRNTYVGSPSNVVIRPNGNDAGSGFEVTANGNYAHKAILRKDAGGNWITQPILYIQQADPGANAPDGSVWGW